MTPNVNLTLIMGAFSIVCTLILGYFNYKAVREKNKNDLTTSVWDQFRKDNDLLTKKVNDCRVEIEKLDEKLDRALEESRTHKAEREKAEAECAETKKALLASQAETEAARALAAKWETECLGEHAAYSVLRHLYDQIVEGRPADPAMLASIQSHLVDLGLSTVPPPVPT